MPRAVACWAGRAPGFPRQRASLGQPPPSQHDSIFWRQSWHHQAERSQNSRCGLPVSGQIMP